MDKYKPTRETYFKCARFLWDIKDPKLRHIYIELFNYAAFKDDYQSDDKQPWKRGEVAISISYLELLTGYNRGSINRKLEKMFRMGMIDVYGWKHEKRERIVKEPWSKRERTVKGKHLIKLLNYKDIQGYGKEEREGSVNEPWTKREGSVNNKIKNKELKIKNNNNHQHEIAEYFVQKKQTKQSLNDDDNLILAEWLEKGVATEKIKLAIDIGCHRKNLNGGGNINSLKYFNDLVTDIDKLEPGKLARYVAGKKG